LQQQRIIFGILLVGRQSQHEPAHILLWWTLYTAYWGYGYREKTHRPAMPESILVTTNRSASSVQVLFADELLCILYPFCNKHSLAVFFFWHTTSCLCNKELGRKSCFVFFPQIGCGAPGHSEIGSHGHMVDEM
jgi:hypothetical protein